MFQFTGFSEKANTALNNAVNCAEDMGHTYIGSEHILAGLLKDPTSVAGVVLGTRKITYQKLYELIKSAVGIGVPTVLGEGDITPKCRACIEKALSVAGSQTHALAGTEHLLLSVLREPQCFGFTLLTRMGAVPSEIASEITKTLSGVQSADAGYAPAGRQHASSGGRTSLTTLTKYSCNLTAAAKAGKIDPVTGRQTEIGRVIRILSRRTKNNPCLIGEPGVGKTAVVEGLALAIAAGDVPPVLQDREIYTLALTGMVAGAKYRGDFEERIRNVVDEVTAAGNIILFIDEIHNIIGAGSAEGAVDAANILKPVLARGEIRLIGATTIDEYRKNIEKDAALERRFQTVTVNEPTESEAMNILISLRPKYEAHHRVIITDEALLAAIKLSVRYIHDRFLPDKAIDLMDEAAAKVSLREPGKPEEIRELEEKAGVVSREKAAAVNAQDFELAADRRDEERHIIALLSEKLAEWQDSERNISRTVTENDIREVVSEWTKIPVNKLSADEKEKLLGLEGELHKSIIGQSAAVEAVASAIRRSRSGLHSPDRPVGSFIFCGPTGVGKTELAKKLAECVYGDKNALIRLDMSEYMEKQAAARLIGAPPGYVGFEEGGQLTERIRRRPFSVILFDEIEKAHPDIFNSLLQMLEDGILTDSQGRTADCRNCIVILTSNAGAEKIGDGGMILGFSEGSRDEREKAAAAAVKSELKKIFRPEFLNRIDETVVFSRLTEDETGRIAENIIEETLHRLTPLGISYEFTPALVKYIAVRGYDENSGARLLRRVIQKEIEDRLSGMLIGGEISSGDKIICDAENDRIIITKISEPENTEPDNAAVTE